MQNQTVIKCSKCGHEVNIEEALYTQLQKKFDIDMQIKRNEYKEALSKFNEQKAALESDVAEFEKKLKFQLEARLREEEIKLKSELTKSIRDKVTAESALQIKELQEELTTKSKQVQELNASKATIARLEREKLEIESKVKADTALEYNRLLEEQKLKIKQETQELQAMKLKEKDEQIQQIKKELENATRKAEQGSMQIQGEAQEKNIEEFLALHFKYDEIHEVSKGAFGADCVQTINTLDFQNCGKICYESKNTKSFSSDWIKKLKLDMLEAGADVGVLVTSVKPKDMQRMGFVEGIWVCSYEEFKGSVALMRESLISIHKATLSQENKAEKMHLLYSYFTGKEFSMQLNTIVTEFVAMQDELNKQKRSFMASMKRQQKHIDSVLISTTSMYGSIKGIAGNAIENVELLELEYTSGEEAEE